MANRGYGANRRQQFAHALQRGGLQLYCSGAILDRDEVSASHSSRLLCSRENLRSTPKPVKIKKYDSPTCINKPDTHQQEATQREEGTPSTPKIPNPSPTLPLLFTPCAHT
jgi:hypothetical protein